MCFFNLVWDINSFSHYATFVGLIVDSVRWTFFIPFVVL
jgi:hypothetical protein